MRKKISIKPLIAKFLAIFLGILPLATLQMGCEINAFHNVCTTAERCAALAKRETLENGFEDDWYERAREFVEKAYEIADDSGEPVDLSWALVADFTVEAEACLGGLEFLFAVSDIFLDTSSLDDAEPIYALYAYNADSPTQQIAESALAYECLNNMQEILGQLPVLDEENQFLEGDFRIHRILVNFLRLPFVIQDTNRDGRVDVIETVPSDDIEGEINDGTTLADAYDIISLRGLEPQVNQNIIDFLNELTETNSDLNLEDSTFDLLKTNFDLLVEASAVARKLLLIFDDLREAAGFVDQDFAFIGEAINSDFYTSLRDDLFGIPEATDPISTNGCDGSGSTDLFSFNFEGGSFYSNLLDFQRGLEESYALLTMYSIALQQAMMYLGEFDLDDPDFDWEEIDAILTSGGDWDADDWEALYQQYENDPDSFEGTESSVDVLSPSFSGSTDLELTLFLLDRDNWLRSVISSSLWYGGDTRTDWDETAYDTYISNLSDEEEATLLENYRIHVHATQRGLVSLHRNGQDQLPGMCDAGDSLAEFSVSEIVNSPNTNGRIATIPNPCYVSPPGLADRDGDLEPYNETTAYDLVYDICLDS